MDTGRDVRSGHRECLGNADLVRCLSGDVTNPGDVRARVAGGRALRLAFESGAVVSPVWLQLREEDRTPLETRA